MFVVGLTCIRNRIAELIREVSQLEVVYEESQKKFTGVMKQIEEEVGKYLKTVYGRLHHIHGRELRQPPAVFELIQHLTLHSSCGGHGGHASCLADFSAGEHVSLSLEVIPLTA